MVSLSSFRAISVVAVVKFALVLVIIPLAWTFGEEKRWTIAFSDDMEVFRREELFWPGSIVIKVDISSRGAGETVGTDTLEVCFKGSTENDEKYVLMDSCIKNSTRVADGRMNMVDIPNGRHKLLAALFLDGTQVSNSAEFSFVVGLTASPENGVEENNRQCEAPAARERTSTGVILKYLGGGSGLAYGNHRNAHYVRRLTVEGGVTGETIFVHETGDVRLVAERSRGGLLEQQRVLLEGALAGGCGSFNTVEVGSSDDHKPSFVLLDGGGGRDLQSLVSRWYAAPSMRLIVVSNYSSSVALRNEFLHRTNVMVTKDDELVVVKDNGGELNSRLAIIVVSITHPGLPYDSRPWTPVVMERIQRYATKCEAEVLVFKEIHDAGCDAANFRLCGMLMKLKALREGFKEYDRVLLLDDTTLVRGDTANLFQVVPEEVVGGVYEEYRGEAIEAKILNDMWQYYGVGGGLKPGGGHVVNTGVLLLSKKHHYDMLFNNGIWSDQHYVKVKTELFGDQGYVNAMMVKEWGWDWGGHVMNLGPRFNFVGSFENVNRMKVDFAREESYIIHATTGLFMKFMGDEGGGFEKYVMINDDEGVKLREKYMKEIDEKWAEQGI